ncbi:hypothetical protein ACWCP8_05705 [Streptomyces sp. NPDC002206]
MRAGACRVVLEQADGLPAPPPLGLPERAVPSAPLAHEVLLLAPQVLGEHQVPVLVQQERLIPGQVETAEQALPAGALVLVSERAAGVAAQLPYGAMGDRVHGPDVDAGQQAFVVVSSGARLLCRERARAPV